VIRWAFAAAVACAACAAYAGAACGGAADSERRGDEAYGRGQYAQALKEYRLLLGGKAHPRIWAKAAAAALRTGDLPEAADAYLHLAGEDPSRTQEAAEGLEAVARAAERADRPDALQQAVVGLQTVAPDRVPGPYALILAQKEGAEPAELVGLLPRAIAAAPDQATVDSLLALHARLLQQTSGCGQAMFQYRAVLRRTQDTSLVGRARKGAADCALSLGQRAVTSGRDEDAALWFAEAARMDSSSATGRRALFAYGETRLIQGDTLAAALAYQAIAADAAVSDAFSGKARARLAALGLTPTTGPDTGPDSP
jgi:tetratricopeptide (TPR) repeat protein